MPELSVVIPTIGRNPTLERVLDRLGTQRRGADFEVLVVSDAAEPDPDAVGALLGERPYPARHLRAERPGASAARNRGWREAASPLVLFVDDDVLPEPPLVAEHLAWHGREPAVEVGVLGRLRWARELRVTAFMRFLEHGVQFDYPSIEGTEAGWGRFYTANVSVKRAALERVGGFDEERLPFGLEDLDLAYRLDRGLGFRLLYNRAAAAEHHHPMDLAFWRRRVRRIAAAEYRFSRLHPDVEPYFLRMFSDAVARPRARGRGRALIRWVPRSAPLIGPYVWRSAELHYRQALAPDFLDAWERAGSDRGPGDGAQPDLSERAAASSAGSPPAGPK